MKEHSFRSCQKKRCKDCKVYLVTARVLGKDLEFEKQMKDLSWKVEVYQQQMALIQAKMFFEEKHAKAEARCKSKEAKSKAAKSKAAKGKASGRPNTKRGR